MSHIELGDPVLRKLERLMERPLGGATPRLHKALGIDGLEMTLTGSAGMARRRLAARQEAISGCALGKSTVRLRNELGL
jgi:hypothetical protein